jgi:hypothetical protein
LNEQVTGAVDHADSAGIHFHFPLIAIAFAAGQNFHRYRKGAISMEQALNNFGERGALAVIATGAGWVVTAVTHATLIAIPVSMGTRMLGGQLLHNRDRRNLMDSYIESVSSSWTCLELEQLPRLLFEGLDATGLTIQE